MVNDAEARTLTELLAAASHADGLTRIEYRDPIAAFGREGAAAVVPWLSDKRLGAFAVRVMGRVGLDRALRPAAIEMLRGWMPGDGLELIARDAAEQLARFEAQNAVEEQERQSAATTKAAVEALVWIHGLPELPGSERLDLSDARDLVSFLSGVEHVRTVERRAALDGSERKNAALSWLRGRLRVHQGRRVSVCWSCHAGVYSDLNSTCPTCHWLICACDACRDPRRMMGACPRTSVPT